jgi:hypothetical protein
MLMSFEREPPDAPLPGAPDVRESDHRAEFAKLGTNNMSLDAERTFLRARLDMIRSDRALERSEKEHAIQELESRLRVIDESEKPEAEK